MSRTYHHGLKARERKFGSPMYAWGERNEWHHPLRGSRPKRKRGAHHMEWMTTPGWWIREMMTVAQRAQVRALLWKVERLKDFEDAPLFPLAKRPHLYYW